MAKPTTTPGIAIDRVITRIISRAYREGRLMGPVGLSDDVRAEIENAISEVRGRSIRKNMERAMVGEPSSMTRVEGNLRDLVMKGMTPEKASAYLNKEQLGGPTEVTSQPIPTTPQREVSAPFRETPLSEGESAMIDRMTRQVDEEGYRRAWRDEHRQNPVPMAEGVNQLELNPLHLIQGNAQIPKMAGEMAKSQSRHIKDPIKVGINTMVNGLRALPIGGTRAADAKFIRGMVQEFLSPKDAMTLYTMRDNPEKARAYIFDLLVPQAQAGQPKPIRHTLQALFRGWLRGPDVSGDVVDWEPITDAEARRRYVLGLPMDKAVEWPERMSGPAREALSGAVAQRLADERTVAESGNAVQYETAQKEYEKKASIARSKLKTAREEARLAKRKGYSKEYLQMLLDKEVAKLPPQEKGIVKVRMTPPSKKLPKVKDLTPPPELASTRKEILTRSAKAKTAAQNAVAAARKESKALADILKKGGVDRLTHYTPEDLKTAEEMLGTRVKQGWAPSTSEYRTHKGMMLPSYLSDAEIAGIEKAAAAAGDEAILERLASQKRFGQLAKVRTASMVSEGLGADLGGLSGGLAKGGLAALALMTIAGMLSKKEKKNGA